MATGANYNVAYTTTTCILMECQWIHSNPIHSGEFFHGPFEVVDKEVPFLVLVGVGREREMDERAVDFLKNMENASQCWMVKSLVLIYSAQQLQSI